MNTVNTANALDLKCLSLNVRGLNRSNVEQNHHIIFLQESYCSKDLESIWENEWGGKAFFSHGTNHSKGVVPLPRPIFGLSRDKAV